MATEQQTHSVTADSLIGGSPIENEIPTYRAISKLAVAGLACGFFSVFSFAGSSFYILSVLALVLGILAKRSINRMPDALTGAGIANAGIAMGLVFGLVSGTVTSVQTFILKREASKFATKYIDVIKAPSLGDVLWYNLHPVQRKDRTTAQMVQEYDSAKTRERMSIEQKMGPVLRLRSRLAQSSEQKIRFVQIEDVGVDEGRSMDINYYALALYEITGPPSKEFPDETQFALVVLKGQNIKKKYEWWADDVAFPYKRKSFVPVSKPVDDGHGHAD